jgi:hypothetical protein
MSISSRNRSSFMAIVEQDFDTGKSDVIYEEFERARVGLIRHASWESIIRVKCEHQAQFYSTCVF